MKKLKIFLLLACIYSQIFKAASAADAAAAAPGDETVETIKNAPGSFTQHLQPFKDGLIVEVTTPFPYHQITPQDRLTTINVRENCFGIIGGKDSKHKNAFIGPCSPCTAIIIKNCDNDKILIVHKILAQTPSFYFPIINDFLKKSTNCFITLLTVKIAAEKLKGHLDRRTIHSDKTQDQFLEELKKSLIENLKLEEKQITKHLLPDPPNKILYNTSNLCFFINTRGIIKSTCYVQENLYTTIQKSDCLNITTFATFLINKLEKKMTRSLSASALEKASDKYLLMNLNDDPALIRSIDTSAFFAYCRLKREEKGISYTKSEDTID